MRSMAIPVVLVLVVAPTASGQLGTTTARQITHSATYDPSFSPDGREMVYIRDVAGHEQLFVGSADGTSARQLTADTVDHEDPAWSPDGRFIAFVQLTATAERIALMPVSGGAVEIVSPPGERGIHPAWTPDGRLSYCTDDDLHPPAKNPADIVVIDLKTHVRRVLITGGVNTYPAWSPDGRHIAFRRMLGSNSEVFLADSGGRNVQNLTNSPAFDGWPAWSPDGRRIAFASNRDGDYQIYTMRADGSGVTAVARNDGRATAPKWSPDGRSIYFPICWHHPAGSDCEIYAAAAGPN
jgi:TolB protein